MSRLILQMQTSVDGYVDSSVPTSRWELWTWGPDWHWTPDLRAFSNSVFTHASGILLSRPMIDEGYLDHWQDVAQQHPDEADYDFARRIGELPKFVVSRTRRPDRDRPGDVTVLNGFLPDVVERAQKEAPGDLVCFGGAGLATSLLRHDLVDELQLFINPGFAGSGTRIF
ncbi:MAG: deaminase, partial [Frankiales bacterium]|nr:deaminase [Frankiales bacterium]